MMDEQTKTYYEQQTDLLRQMNGSKHLIRQYDRLLGRKEHESEKLDKKYRYIDLESVDYSQPFSPSSISPFSSRQENNPIWETTTREDIVELERKDWRNLSDQEVHVLERDNQPSDPSLEYDYRQNAVYCTECGWKEGLCRCCVRCEHYHCICCPECEYPRHECRCCQRCEQLQCECCRECEYPPNECRCCRECDRFYCQCDDD